MARESVMLANTTPDEQEVAENVSVGTAGKKIHVHFPTGHACVFEIKDDGLAYVPTSGKNATPTGREIKKARKIAKEYLRKNTKPKTGYIW